MRSALLLASISILLCATMRSAAQGNVLLHSSSRQKPSAQELLDRAHGLVDLSHLEPYVLTADVIANLGKQEVKGRLTIYRDHNRARFELQIGDDAETQVIVDQTTFLDPEKTLFVRSGLSGVDRTWDPEPSNESALTPRYSLSSVKEDKTATGAAWCLKKRYKGRFAHEVQLCFDAERGVLARNASDEKNHTEFLDYKPVGSTFFPSQIKLFRRMRAPIMLSNLEVIQKPLDANLFSPSPGSLDLEKCADIKPPLAVSTPEPSLAERVRLTQRSGTIVMQAFIDKQGRVTTLTVLNPDRYATPDTIRTVKDWKFKPATCNGHPVNTEMEIEVVFPTY